MASRLWRRPSVSSIDGVGVRCSAAHRQVRKARSALQPNNCSGERQAALIQFAYFCLTVKLGYKWLLVIYNRSLGVMAGLVPATTSFSLKARKKDVMPAKTGSSPRDAAGCHCAG